MEAIATDMASFPLLSLLIGLPFFAAALLWLLPTTQAQRVALLATGAETLLSVLAVWRFDAGRSGFQWVERAQWLPTVNVHYLLGVDGISILFLPLTALLFLGVLLSSRPPVLPRLYYALLLALQGMTIGIFCALDLVLFFLFWELTLLPIYFLVNLWGMGPQRRFAATQYTLWMLGGGVFLLFGFILVAVSHSQQVTLSADMSLSATLTFELPSLLATALPSQQQLPALLLLLCGFAFKTPVVPFHVWLPVMAMEGPVALLAIMTGVKLGAYGILRFALPLAPQAAMQWSWLLAGIGVVGIFYGALMALNQSNMRRLLAFSSISHVGMVLLGISTMNVHGIQGALLQLLNFTLIASALFLLSGFIHRRTASCEWLHLGGLVRVMPTAAFFFLFFAVASMGMPLTSGFPAEQLIILGTIAQHKGAALAAVGGQILGAAYLLLFYRRAFLGSTSRHLPSGVVDLQGAERWSLFLFAIPVLLVGLLPGWLVHFTQLPTVGWLAQMSNQLSQ
ncbi:complex I subunit 4 family protein [Candidatus Magnetaquicoccus inordinatus]|uniref:complex I subunit 4 family protein n=1 Tax=Candidatus Magnetaquicoccus inordinatus TaxID=2496818 RepID=UPI00102B7918|nr:NADH-quinone oxidoreductase subunit M [Candidatus Magnetaquicoccus inordinatus]